MTDGISGRKETFSKSGHITENTCETNHIYQVFDKKSIYEQKNKMDTRIS